MLIWLDMERKCGGADIINEPCKPMHMQFDFNRSTVENILPHSHL